MNYNERALKTHYHQLDIEDLILKLKKLFLEKNNSNSDDKSLIERFDIIMFEYQSILKNNENHDSVDDAKHRFNKIIEDKEFKKKKIKDFTVDNILLHVNMAILLFPIVTIYIYFLK